MILSTRKKDLILFNKIVLFISPVDGQYEQGGGEATPGLYKNRPMGKSHSDEDTFRDEDTNNETLAQRALINELSNPENCDLFGNLLSWTCCSRVVLPLLCHETVFFLLCKR